MKTIIKSILLILLTAVNFEINAQDAYGEIRGTITDNAGEAVPFAIIKILQGTQLMGGTTSDADGNYKYKPLRTGSYEMLVSDPGHQTQPINKINIIPNEATYVNVKLMQNMLGTITVVADPIDYSRSGVDLSMFILKSVDGEELRKNASFVSGNIKSVLEGLSSEVVAGPNGDIHVRGSRDGATGFYIDGVKTLGENSIPGIAIENLTFFTGGVPAMYGDQTSGAVMIATKSYFSGIREKNIRMRAWEEEAIAEKLWKEKQNENRK